MKLLNAPGRTLAAIVAFGILLPIASGKTLHKIKLPPSGNSVRIAGKLRGVDDHKEFIFHGDRGTKVKIVLTGAAPLRGEVTFPSAGHEGSPGGAFLIGPCPRPASIKHGFQRARWAKRGKEASLSRFPWPSDFAFAIAPGSL